MGMTITQASAVNTLLDWVLDRKRPYADGPVTASEALAAATALADGANKTLSAGLRGKDVERLWARGEGKCESPLADTGGDGVIEKLSSYLNWTLGKSGDGAYFCVIGGPRRDTIERGGKTPLEAIDEAIAVFERDPVRR